MIHSAIFLIEGGKPLQLIKEYFKQLDETHEFNRKVSEDLGITEALMGSFNHKVEGVVFPRGKDIHPDFKVPRKRDRVSFPKKGSAWEKRLNEFSGVTIDETVICKELGIVMSLAYKTKDGGEGWQAIGIPFKGCGFLFTSTEEDGVYALYVPDAEKYIKEGFEQRGYSECKPGLDYKIEIKGCKRILDEEWNLIVAKDKAKRAGVAV